jgi:hypothetical protein
MSVKGVFFIDAGCPMKLQKRDALLRNQLGIAAMLKRFGLNSLSELDHFIEF